MNKKILFSPIGGTDPMSQDNYKDGALLHTCRVYRPDEVYLYMSKEIIENEKEDQRYSYCLEKLDELQGRNTKYHWIERPDLEKVQLFDFFYDEFASEIRKISGKMDESDTLLINISSGTPAMKSALLVLVTMIDIDCKVIQVSTPIGKMNDGKNNDKDSKKYLIKELWEMSEDNVHDFKNRCEEVKCPALSLIKNEEIIKKHIEAYDYAAAYRVASSLPANKTPKYLPLLQVAYHRYLLDSQSIDKLKVSEAAGFFPVKSGDAKKYFEYALNLGIKYKRGEYADFMRAISPLVVDLFELILKCQYGVNIDNYCIYDKKRKTRSWDKEKLQNTEILEMFEDGFGEFKYGPIYSSQLIVLIERYENKNLDLKSLVSALRDVEQNLRNKVAHQIISVTDEFIKNETGYTGKQIIDLIKKAFKFAGININKEYWNSYDDMNTKIFEAMKRK